MDKIIFEVKNGANNIKVKSITEGIFVLILLPGLMEGMFYVGRLTGEAIASWF
ncbi:MULTISPECIES: hypothetical protein [unclassified Streptococcus]|uniref:hypothetical protein n=1 Tax=unclassified Streptococcus TaxID=2608887 RepID=UPI0018A91BE2|nr:MULTISPECIES: hypothetical protein [unclassified Streptococcus]MBF8969807.1 hypothetical protein [Streptococcus sp. NLN76]MBG9366696.1 hypothetical protein [Streptococcus sp. NLN64]